MYSIDGVKMDKATFDSEVEQIKLAMENRPPMDGLRLLDFELKKGGHIESSIDESEYNVIKNREWFDHHANMKFVSITMLSEALGVSRQALGKTINSKYPAARVAGFKRQGVNVWHGSDRDGDNDPRYPCGGLSSYLIDKGMDLYRKGVRTEHIDLWTAPKHGKLFISKAVKRASEYAATGVRQDRKKATQAQRKRDIERQEIY